MKLPTKLVAVKKINSKVARSQFSVEGIEKTAQLIIAVEGVINPIILDRTSLESYEVVAGHFEYYAAVRAREVNPLKGEMIQAIILEPNNEEAILAQISCLRSQSSQPSSSDDTKLDNSSDSSQLVMQTDLELRLVNLEKIFQSQFEELRKDNRRLESKIGELQQLNQHTVQPHLDDELIVDKIVGKLATVIEKLPKPSAGKNSKNKPIEALTQNPVNLNDAHESELCSVPQIGPATAREIIEWRTANGSFSSVDELKKLSSFNHIKRNPKWEQCFTVVS